MLQSEVAAMARLLSAMEMSMTPVQWKFAFDVLTFCFILLSGHDILPQRRF
jgi:hypothetical protein